MVFTIDPLSSALHNHAMSIFKKILHFIGGKPPEIIFKNGEVSHIHPAKKWQDWKKRFENNPEYKWNEHSGFADKSQPHKD
jgi:hypothetical protein